MVFWQLTKTIKDWMLALIVLAFLVIDLIILFTYTIVVGVIDKDQLKAREVINVENPVQIDGVSYQNYHDKYHNYIIVTRHMSITHYLSCSDTPNYYKILCFNM